MMKVIGFKDASLLRANVVFEEDEIKIMLEKGINQTLMDKLSAIQNLSFDDKVEFLKAKEYNVGENNEDIYTRLVEYIKDNNILTNINEDDFEFSEEEILNTTKYRGDNVPIIDNLKYFEGKKVSSDVINLVKNIYEDKITDNYSSEILEQMTNLVMYVGSNEKYKGCIGMIVQNRNDIASNLIEFPGKYKDSGAVCSYWSEPRNLMILKEL